MSLSLKDLYKHFDYVRFEPALTTIQINHLQGKILNSYNSFINKDFCAIGLVTDVTENNISVVISIWANFTRSESSDSENVTTARFLFDIQYDSSYREQAMKLNKSNYIQFSGQIISLRVQRLKNWTNDWVDEKALKLGFYFYPQYEIKLNANKIKIEDPYVYGYNDISKTELTPQESLIVENAKKVKAQKDFNKLILNSSLGLICFFIANYLFKGHVFWSILAFLVTGCGSLLAIIASDGEIEFFFENWLGPISFGLSMGILFYWFGWL